MFSTARQRLNAQNDRGPRQRDLDRPRHPSPSQHKIRSKLEFAPGEFPLYDNGTLNAPYVLPPSYSSVIKGQPQHAPSERYTEPDFHAFIRINHSGFLQEK